MTRALRLIENNAPIAEICSSIKNEPDYKSLSNRRRQERDKRGLRNANEKDKLAKVIRKGEPKPPRVVDAAAVPSAGEGLVPSLAGKVAGTLDGVQQPVGEKAGVEEGQGELTPRETPLEERTT